MHVEPLDPAASQPPFEQLRCQIATRAASGDLPPGTRLPTVRALAAELGVAVNTVARAYRELEADGVVVTEGRRGTFLALVHGARPAATDAAKDYVHAARHLGLSLPEARKLLEDAWSTPA